MGASTQQYSSVEVWRLKGKHLNGLLKVIDGIVLLYFFQSYCTGMNAIVYDRILKRCYV